MLAGLKALRFAATAGRRTPDLDTEVRTCCKSDYRDAWEPAFLVGQDLFIDSALSSDC